MAHYSRTFLVPYLEKLCTLHLIHDKLQSQYTSAETRKLFLEKKMEIVCPPAQPEMKSTGIAGMIFGAVFIAIGWLDIPVLSFVAKYGGWITLVSAFIIWLSERKENAEKSEVYQAKYIEYVQHRNAVQNDLKIATSAFNAVERGHARKINEIKSVLNKMYAVNIIPMKYRDKYAIAYLYDWFSNSQSDDMDMALNTYVLEEIKDRLDVIIDQFSRVIMNQQIMIAQQYSLAEQQEQYHREMVAKLDRLQTTAEEHNTYLRMIEADTSALTLFATVDFFGKKR